MHYNSSFIIFAGALYLQVAAVPPSPNPGLNTAPGLALPGFTAPSSTPSIATFASLTTASAAAHATVHTNVPHPPVSTAVTSLIQQLTHSSDVLVSIATTSLQASSIIFPTPSLMSILIPSGLPQTLLGSSSSSYPPISSSPVREPTTPLPSVSSLLPTRSSTSSINIAPTIRYVLIAILAGLPTLTVLGFLIASCRRRRACDYAGSNPLFEPTNINPSQFKEKKNTRFSSFFSVTGNLYQEKVNGKEKRQLYATSIHSSAGLAGVGAHRGCIDNGIPPMIKYVKMTERRYDADTHTKTNFENPFGTPPTVNTGFVIAPSRVSPQITRTPFLQLVPITPTFSPNNLKAGAYTQQSTTTRQTTNGGILSEERSIDQENLNYVKVSQGGHNEVRKMQTHVRFVPKPLKFGHYVLPSHIPTDAPSYKPPSLSHHRRSSLVRASVDHSIYGGITSPCTLDTATSKTSPTMSPLVPSPLSEQTSVLPYLASLTTRVPPPYTQAGQMGPVIVIESPSTIDSMSNYGEDSETVSLDEVEESSLEKEARVGVASYWKGSTRRDGLVGSPPEYIPPSSTFSTVSSYPASVSSAAFQESSTSSASVLPASSSDDSSITIKAAIVKAEIKFRKSNRVPHSNIEVF